jgi:hypothetical protein
MDLKICAVILLIGFLSILYHTGKPQDFRDPDSA